MIKNKTKQKQTQIQSMLKSVYERERLCVCFIKRKRGG